jgi:hypothetical protein
VCVWHLFIRRSIYLVDPICSLRTDFACQYFYLSLSLFVAISRAQPRIEAKIDVKLFGGSQDEVVVKARLDEDSGLRFTETYESASVLGQVVDIPEALQYSRDLYVSYVDEDILVVRDGSGVPEILVRK